MSTHTKCHRLAPGGALLTGILFLLPACGGEAESRDAAGDERLDGTTVEASALDGRAAEPPRTREPVPAIPTGTRMTLEMLETVSTSSHATGDVFTLRLVEDVQGVAGGRLAAGTRARGVVEKARRSTDSDEEALLLLRVTEVERGGAWTPVVARVESAAVQASAQDSGTRTAAKIDRGQDRHRHRRRGCGGPDPGRGHPVHGDGCGGGHGSRRGGCAYHPGRARQPSPWVPPGGGPGSGPGPGLRLPLASS